MLYEGDVDCVEQLLKPAKKITAKGSGTAKMPYKKRVQLWNTLKENLDRYEDGECGTFLDDLDRHYRAIFDVALLVLDKAFDENGEDFGTGEFSHKEYQVYEQIEKYNVFEILTIQDVKKKVVSRDENLLNLFREYYVFMDDWVDATLEDAEIRLTVRYYLKKKWDDYNGKLTKAVNELISELGWFRKLINDWQNEAERSAEEATEAMEQKLEDRERQLEEKEEEIKRIVAEVRNVKEKIDQGTRYVTSSEAKFYENNFIGRLKRKLRGEIPVDDMTFTVENIEEGEERPISFHQTGLSEKDKENLPENRWMQAQLKEKKLLGQKHELLVEVRFCSRVEQLANYGVDTDPLELDDINPYLTRVLRTPENETLLLCIASPTGFSHEVEQHVQGESFHQNFLSHVSVCLIDMETGDVILNPHDELAKRFTGLCSLEIDRERQAEVNQCIWHLLMEKDYVTLRAAMDSCGSNKRTVKKVFYDLENMGKCGVRHVKDAGLVAVKKIT